MFSSILKPQFPSGGWDTLRLRIFLLTIQVFKQRLSRRLRGKKCPDKSQLALRFPGDELLRRFWQRRYYDFNVYSRAKAQEKLHYMHANPVREKLVAHPGDWPWSSWCFYFRGAGLLQMDPWF